MRLATPAVGDPERGHLQRSGHRRADPARPARRALPRRVGRERTAPQPAGLRARRHRRALHRHQAHRPRPLGASGRVMRRQLPPALVIFAVFTVLMGVVYPLVVTGIAQVAFGAGRRLARRARRRGRGLLADRPGVRGARVVPPAPVGGRRRLRRVASGPSNLGPTNPGSSTPWRSAWRSIARRRPGAGAVPVDAVTGSGSGLDPHISPANARLQAARVRTLAACRWTACLAWWTRHRGPALGFLGEPGVNVLELNLALDERR